MRPLLFPLLLPNGRLAPGLGEGPFCQIHGWTIHYRMPNRKLACLYCLHGLDAPTGELGSPRELAGHP